MADTIREQVMKKVQAGLREIRKANNYANNINPDSVQRFKQGGISTLEPPVLLIEEGPEEPTYTTVGLINIWLDVFISIVIVQDEETDPRPGAEIINSLMGDVFRAMAANPSWDDVAIDTEYRGATPIYKTEGNAKLDVSMQFGIHFRHNRTDPTSKV